eukprot:1154968-Pelagomonas_calceolata.AAC.3
MVAYTLMTPSASGSEMLSVFMLRLTTPVSKFATRNSGSMLRLKAAGRLGQKAAGRLEQKVVGSSAYKEPLTKFSL